MTVPLLLFLILNPNSTMASTTSSATSSTATTTLRFYINDNESSFTCNLALQPHASMSKHNCDMVTKGYTLINLNLKDLHLKCGTLRKAPTV